METNVDGGIFSKRCLDQTKTPLAEQFVAKLQACAVANDMHEDVVWARWQGHCRENEIMDQSPTWGEFLRWNNLSGDR